MKSEIGALFAVDSDRSQYLFEVRAFQSPSPESRKTSPSLLPATHPDLTTDHWIHLEEQTE